MIGNEPEGAGAGSSWEEAEDNRMKKQLGVIFGSRSCEREVAIISAV